jgi:protein-tyrosine phosphatase
MHFPQALEFIQSVHSTHSENLPKHEKNSELTESGEKGKQRVLVHCAVGRSRSAAVVIAYMMVNMKMPLFDAFLKVKTIRDSVLPSIQPL